jgi:glycosyltransferase involved in cell wall biosynthesis
MEILIVDGMSVDATREIVCELAHEHPAHTIQLLDNPDCIFSTGFNLGLQQARGEVIVMLGGHTEIAVDYVQRCVAHLKDPGVDCVGGSINTVAEDFLGQAIAIAMSSAFGVGGATFRIRTDLKAAEEVDTVAFGAYKRKSFEMCGLLDEEMVRNQDDEYNYRLRGMGRRIFLVPDLHLKYYSRTSFYALSRQYYQYGFWKVRVLQKHPRQMRLRQFVPPAFVLMLLLGVLASFMSTLGRWALCVAAGTYLLANLGASLWAASRRDWRSLPLLPLIFAVLHLSYGLGFLVGLVKFAKRWGDKQGKTPAFENKNVQVV